MAGLGRGEKFRLVTGSVMPRPIALVTTLNPDGSCNAAPFSAFNYMCEDPPIFAIGFDRYGAESPRRKGETKDTLENIRVRGEFVVNMVDAELLDGAVACAADYPAGTSEPLDLGLDLAPSTMVATPRIAAAPIAWESRTHSIIELGPARTMLLGEILAINFREGLLDTPGMRVNIDHYFPVGRLAGPNYTLGLQRVVKPIPSGPLKVVDL